MPLIQHFTGLKETFNRRVILYFSTKMSASILGLKRFWYWTTRLFFFFFWKHEFPNPEFFLCFPPFVLSHISFEIFPRFDKRIWWSFLVDLQISSSTFKKKKHWVKKQFKMFKQISQTVIENEWASEWKTLHFSIFCWKANVVHLVHVILLEPPFTEQEIYCNFLSTVNI